jgi:uncharacterized protein (TIGR02246 family)
VAAKKAKTPGELHSRFVQALNAGDLDGLLALYTEESCLLPSLGQEARGLKAIREAHSMLVGLRPAIQLTTRRITSNGDFALLSSDWRLKGTMPDGSPVETAGRSAEVGRRGADGNWYYLIDDPNGGE